MSQMKKRCAIFSISRTDKSDHLHLNEEWSQKGAKPLEGGYSNLFVLREKSAMFLAAYTKEKGDTSLYQIDSKQFSLSPTQSHLNFNKHWDILEPFVVGNLPYVLCYRAKTGVFEFFPITNQLSSGTPFHFNRTHDPGITSEFSMVKPVVYQGNVYYMGYNEKTGAVALYSLAVTATSTGGIPPLSSVNVWSHLWAKGWTRFAFFQLGGEVFFLKTNTWKPNVNIDHIFDDFTKGTYEVCSHMNLKDAQVLDIVSPFALKTGEPFFVAYKKTGEVTLYRIHSDCMGWTEVGFAKAMPGASHIVPVSVEGKQLLIFYSNF